MLFLGQYDWRGQLVPSGKGMAGVLSVGGTSAQLTSELEDEKQAPKEGVRLQLYGQTHRVHTRQCPCHGTEQLRSRLLSVLIQVSVCQGHLQSSWAQHH